MSVDGRQAPKSRLGGISIASLAARAISLARNPAMGGIAGVFALKFSLVVLNFTLIMLAARVLDSEDFGIYSILFSAAGLFGIVATFGQQVSVMRSWNESLAADDPATLRGALRFSIVTCLIGCAIIAVGFFLWASSVYSVILALAVTLFVVAEASTVTTSHLVRTAIGVGTGDGYRNFFLLAPPTIYLAACFVGGTPAELSTIFLLFAAGGLAVILLHFILMWRKLHALYPHIASIRPRYDRRAWIARSFRLWVSNGLDASNQYLDVLIIGYLMSPMIAGAYFVTTRLANAFATASDAMHMFSTRYIPDLHFRGERKKLDSLLNYVAAITLAFVIAGMSVILVGGQWLLTIFNVEYASYYPALAMLCFGTAAIASAGPSGSILMLTGHEGRYLSIITISVLTRAIGFFVLIPGFGIMGAVSATTISFLLMAIMLRQSSKSLTGLDASILRLARRQRPAFA